MKKYLLLIIFGWILHMSYLDYILLKQHQIIDACDVNEEPDKNGILPCLKQGNDTPNRFYLKYFGIYTLVKWNNIVTGPWELE